MTTPSLQHPWRQSVKVHKARKAPGTELHPHLTCPTCGEYYALTAQEARKGYQCINCTALDEFGL